MKKREFLRNTCIVGAGLAFSPLLAFHKQDQKGHENFLGADLDMPFTLPALGYETKALEPAIDALTMQIHHDKHHAAYVEKLNISLNGKAYRGSLDLETICLLVLEEDAAIRNNAGGHYNHSMLWKWMKPGGAKVPTSNLAQAINDAFTNYDEFRMQFIEAALSRFGSGWAWLSVDSDKKLFISSTPNQDNPLMKNLVKKTGTPILGIDLWEHAYYLHYQNKRSDYFNAFMNIINWDEVKLLYVNALKN